MTKAGVIGCGIQELGYESDYYGPYNKALYNKYHELIDNLGITEGITGASLGAETIWAWSVLELGMDLTCLLGCQDFGDDWVSPDKTRLNVIKRQSHAVYLASPGFNEIKEKNRDRVLIQRSDIVIFVFTFITERISNALRFARELDRETIIIKPKEFFEDETITIQKDREASSQN